MICDTISSNIVFSDNVLRKIHKYTATVSWDVKISWTPIFLKLMMIYTTLSSLMPAKRPGTGFFLLDLYFSFLTRECVTLVHFQQEISLKQSSQSLLSTSLGTCHTTCKLSTILFVSQLHTNCTKILTI